MNQIVKICKKHGELTNNQIVITKPKLQHHNPSSLCKLCRQENLTKYYLENKQKIIDRSEQWRINNKDKMNEIHRKYRISPKGKIAWQKHYQANKEKIIARTRAHQKNSEVKERYKYKQKIKTQRHKLAKYGITLDQYEQMFNNQNGVCAICFEPETIYDSRLKVTKRLAIDHCHLTNKVRGLLCSRCNLGLGRFKDSIKIFELIIKYLNRK